MGVLMLMSASGCSHVTVLVINLVLRSVIATVCHNCNFLVIYEGTVTCGFNSSSLVYCQCAVSNVSRNYGSTCIF